MQDDVYALVADGWDDGREIEKDTKKKNEWEGRLIPKQLIISRYFSPEQKATEKLEVDRDDITRQMEGMAEEHGGEDGLLNEVINDKGKIVKTVVQQRIKEVKGDEESSDELKILEEYLKLLEQESELNKEIKEALSALDKQVQDKYKALDIDEIKTLVVEDKWLTKLAQDVQMEIQRVSQRLSGRIKELAERYEITLPQLNTQAAELEKKVNGHLGNMGFLWK